MYAATMMTEAARSALGFSLIELMIVIMIAAILMVAGIPALEDFMADQHVRSVTSDLAGDIAFARYQAVENSHRTHLQMTPGPSWTNGWRVYVDLNDNDAYDVGEQRKIFNGSSGTIRVCNNVGDFATDIIFRPDGRVVRISVPTMNDGIYVIDQMNNGDPTHTKIRGILFGLDGRTHVENLNPNNLAVPLPC